MAKEIIFVDGVRFSKRDVAPSYVVGSLSFKVPELINFLNKHQNNAGYVNSDIKMSKGGNYYIELNTWKPTQDKVKEETNNQTTLNNDLDPNDETNYPESEIDYPDEDISIDDIPF